MQNDVKTEEWLLIARTKKGKYEIYAYNSKERARLYAECASKGVYDFVYVTKASDLGAASEDRSAVRTFDCKRVCGEWLLILRSKNGHVTIWTYAHESEARANALRVKDRFALALVTRTADAVAALEGIPAHEQ